MGLRSSEGLVFYLGVALRSFSPFVRDSNHPCDEERAGWGILFGERESKTLFIFRYFASSAVCVI
jgi:hypothetical protein